MSGKLPERAALSRILPDPDVVRLDKSGLTDQNRQRFEPLPSDIRFPIMTDHVHAETDPSHAHPEPPPNPFTPAEVRQFDEEDAEAGAAIGKMLSLFFLYTVVVMAGSAFATYVWVTTSTIN